LSLFRSSRSQAKIVFCLLTGLAVSVSLVCIYVAPRYGALAEEVAIVPLFLTEWIGAAWYRRRLGGRQWERRVVIAMGVSGALGGLGALAAMMPWTEWPSIGNVALWSFWLVIGSVLFGVAAVPLMWLGDRRLLRIRVKRRNRTSGTHHPKDPPADASAAAPGSQLPHN
jgi:hypothetical protein